MFLQSSPFSSFLFQKMAKELHGSRMILFILLYMAFIIPAISQTCKISYRLLDEHGDQSSVMRQGGTAQVFCTSGYKALPQLQLLNKNLIKQAVNFAIQQDNSSFHIPIQATGTFKDVFVKGSELQCRCSDTGRTSPRLKLGSFLCDPRIPKTSDTCSGKEVCQVHTQGGGYVTSCGQWSCSSGKSEKGSFYVCSQPTPVEAERECDSLNKLDETGSNWPTAEISDEDTLKYCPGTHIFPCFFLKNFNIKNCIFCRIGELLDNGSLPERCDTHQ